MVEVLMIVAAGGLGYALGLRRAAGRFQVYKEIQQVKQQRGRQRGIRVRRPPINR